MVRIVTLTETITGPLLLDGLLDRSGGGRPPLARALVQLGLVPGVGVEVHQVLLLDVELQVYVRTEALPAVETEERSLSRVGYQVMLQTYRDFERSVALGTDLVLGAALRVYQMTEAVEHYLVPRIEDRNGPESVIVLSLASPPPELSVALTAGDLSCRRGLVPINSSHHSISQMKLVINLPFFIPFDRKSLKSIRSFFLSSLLRRAISFACSRSSFSCSF